MVALDVLVRVVPVPVYVFVAVVELDVRPHVPQSTGHSLVSTATNAELVQCTGFKGAHSGGSTQTGSVTVLAVVSVVWLVQVVPLSDVLVRVVAVAVLDVLVTLVSVVTVAVLVVVTEIVLTHARHFPGHAVWTPAPTTGLSHSSIGNVAQRAGSLRPLQTGAERVTVVVVLPVVAVRLVGVAVDVVPLVPLVPDVADAVVVVVGVVVVHALQVIGHAARSRSRSLSPSMPREPSSAHKGAALAQVGSSAELEHSTVGIFVSTAVGAGVRTTGSRAAGSVHNPHSLGHLS